MKHYFTDNTDLKSEQSQFIFRFHKYDLLFTSDNGVFSKSMIDYGSRVLLDNIEITNEKTLLDVGCGYGTFGICLNKVYSHLNVDMVDVNDRALELAKLNAKNNNIHANIYKSFIYENVQGSYDVIVTNPPVRAGKEVVTTILQQLNILMKMEVYGLFYKRNKALLRLKIKWKKFLGIVKLLKEIRDITCYIV